MEQSIQDTIESCAAASHAGTISFGEVVGRLLEQGVESYRVDYRLRATDYYLSSGATHTLPLKTTTNEIADAFDKDALVAAIRGAQSGAVKYPEFVLRSTAAGCVGYVAWLSGRHVTYFGRRGETHVEHFPSAAT